jgi:dihydrofolate reductase
VGRLIYSTIQSLDGYIADRDDNFDWSQPDEELHTFMNDLERSVGTHLYGRRMYEVMIAWETLSLAGQPPFIQDFAQIWRTAEEVVYSKSLERLSSGRTRLEREFDPETDRQMKVSGGGT